MVTSSFLLREQFDGAQAAWMQGDWRAAHTGAKAVLSQSLAAREPRFQARASLLLGQVLTLQSQFGLAAQFASQARKLFAAQQDEAGVADTMLAESYIESALGHDTEAVAAAECVAAGGHGVQRRAAGGLTYRGVAAVWRGDYPVALSVLEGACRLAPEETTRSASAFQPLVNAIFAEVLRCADHRMKGARAELGGLETMLAEAWTLARAGSTQSVASVSALPGMFLLAFATCFFASRAGQGARADKYYLRCLEQASLLPETSWMHALVWWARLERSIAAGEVQEASLSAQRMLVIAGGGEHEGMKALARRVGSEAQDYLARAASPYATFM